MLSIIVGEEGFNNATQEFQLIDPITLELEHSLVSLSKWESKYQKPFLSGEPKTMEEMYFYIEAMLVNPKIPPENFLDKVSAKNLLEIQKYIDSPQSATTFGAMPNRKGLGEIITAEVIYYWMIAFTIPFECQYWHLNRLFALVRVCNIKNSKPDQVSKHDAAVERARINAERKKRLGTRG